MNMLPDPVWQKLRQAGIVDGNPPEPTGSETPWFVHALLAFSGWLAAIFLLGFIGTLFALAFDNAAVGGVLGLVILVGAYKLLCLSRNTFAEHLGLAASLAGQSLIAFALLETYGTGGPLPWLVLTLLQIVLAWKMPSFVHQVLSSFAAAITFDIALIVLCGFPIASAIALALASGCCLNEFRWANRLQHIRAIGYGLTLATIQLTGMGVFGTEMMEWRSNGGDAFAIPPWIAQALHAAVAIGVVAGLLHRYGQPLSSRLSIGALLAIALLGLVALEVHGVAVGIIIVLLGFFGANRALLGLGAAALLFYISAYYYLLSITLLEKAQILLGVGLLLLALRWTIRLLLSARREVRHA